jgi:hypothetical protein
MPWAARSDALEPLIELAVAKPSLFLSKMDLIIDLLLSFMTPDTLGLYEFTTVRRDSQYDASNCHDIGMLSSELLLALVEAFPEYFLHPHRRQALQDIVGTYVGTQINAFSDQQDCQEWVNAIVSPKHRQR